MERIEAVHVGDVDRAAEGAEGLGQPEQPFAGSNVNRGIAGSIRLNIKSIFNALVQEL